MSGAESRPVGHGVWSTDVVPHDVGSVEAHGPVTVTVVAIELAHYASTAVRLEDLRSELSITHPPGDLSCCNARNGVGQPHESVEVMDDVGVLEYV